MRLATRQLVGLLLVLLMASHANAQTWGSCEPGTALRFLETPVLKASVFNTGGLFFGGETTSGDGYLIPKQAVTSFGTGLSPVFAAGLWLGGTVDGQVRVAAARYGSWDFWPGPLEDAASPPTDCSEYDRIYVVSRDDIRRFYATGELTNDLRDWPHPLGAPVIDGDGNPDNYDLRAGDQPDLIGDVAAWWVMNDAGNDHGTSGPNGPLGVEVRVLAFAYSEGAVSRLWDATFFRYELTNKGDQPIENMYASMFSDPDLGDAGDDYIGTDTLRNMVFVYNADPADASYDIPPAWGMQILQGPTVDEGTLGLTGSSTFHNGPFAGWPYTAVEHYNYMQGLWVNGEPMRIGHGGFQMSGAITTFLYPGDPVTQSFWSLMNIDRNGTKGPRGDRRMVASTGPFTIEPDSTQTILVAMPFGQGTDYLNSITVMRGLAGGLQQAHANGFFASRPVTGQPIDPSSRALRLSRVAPNPSQEGAIARLYLPTDAPVHAAVYDMLGRQLEVIVNRVLPKGATELAIPEGLPAGTYRLRVRVAPGGEETLTFTVAR